VEAAAIRIEHFDKSSNTLRHGYLYVFASSQSSLSAATTLKVLNCEKCERHLWEKENEWLKRKGNERAKEAWAQLRGGVFATKRLRSIAAVDLIPPLPELACTPTAEMPLIFVSVARLLSKKPIWGKQYYAAVRKRFKRRNQSRAFVFWEVLDNVEGDHAVDVQSLGGARDEARYLCKYVFVVNASQPTGVQRLEVPFDTNPPLTTLLPDDAKRRLGAAAANVQNAYRAAQRPS